ncbi:MAG: hypothetical protein PHI37_00260 [Candidatus Gracilibacteria bacterium]|nr:hypothetical protein [Candidatus Gracilibacteria bacterium]
MKEKIKKIVKLINIKVFKIGFLILLILFIVREGYGIYIDNYNFKQLEKAKPILETIKEGDERFFSLNEFNERYGADIKPIKNCYYVSNYNGEEKYIFGFKLESLFNMFIYKHNYFAYPRYNIPYEKRLYYDDYNLFIFEEVISKLCRD